MRRCCTRRVPRILISFGLFAAPAGAGQLFDQGFAATGLPTPVSLAASHDERHLYVVDASVMPTTASTHTMIPVMTLADRAAHGMLERSG